MRPIVRGPIPAVDGQAMTFNNYSEAKKPLIERLGDYCSYCEMPCNEGPDVEHIQPKSLRPELERDWTNFVVSCVFCNTVKGSTPVVLEAYLWPDRDNTFRSFIYERDRAPEPSVELGSLIKFLARSTLDLVGLNREPGNPRLTKNDRRWQKRKDAWGRANLARDCLQSQPSEEMRTRVVLNATSTGFWSVWMTVFAPDPDMIRRLLNARNFPGPCVACFDQNLRPIAREGGLC